MISTWRARAYTPLLSAGRAEKEEETDAFDPPQPAAQYDLNGVKIQDQEDNGPVTSPETGQ